MYKPSSRDFELVMNEIKEQDATRLKASFFMSMVPWRVVREGRGKSVSPTTTHHMSMVDDMSGDMAVLGAGG